MKLLTKTREIEKEFKRLINSYSEFFWASAWAGVGFECFTDLKRNKDKIRQIVIGTLFDQTHPDFIREFIGIEGVRFLRQEKGTFHPKIYLFQNNPSDWEMLVGSMNFTGGGFSDNTEVMALISPNDCDAASIYENAKKLIEDSWIRGENFSEQELSEYTRAWENQQRRSGKYGKGKPGKPINRVEIMNWTWEEFVHKVKTEKAINKKGEEYPNIFHERLKVLDMARELFRKHSHFKLMNKDAQRGLSGFIGGKNCEIDWFLFGSTRGAIVFANRVNQNNKHISLALDKIPFEGEVTKTHYENFLDEIKNAFPEGFIAIATASRLLSMKRPDIFICLNKKNRENLCKDFGMKKSNEFKKLTERTQERYWDEIIERIQDSDWWNAPPPKDEIEKKIWDGRSAFIDAIYYDPSSLNPKA
ncbi:MAG: phospholipase D family protein [Candidatus Altiarchaeota archaeon]